MPSRGGKFLAEKFAFAVAFFVLLAMPGTADVLGDGKRGAALFAKCKGCHQVGKGAENGVGPHLNELFGRRAGSVAGFKYSKAFQRAGTKGLEWHADTLGTFIANPRSLVPGTRMSFRGYDDPIDQADLLAYLRTFSVSPADIPEADPTARGIDHDVDPAILAIAGDPEYGAYLSSECTTCHQAEGSDAGIPSIVLWPEEVFVIAMHAYKDNARAHPVMNMIAGRLGDEEIAALAAYFATLEH